MVSQSSKVEYCLLGYNENILTKTFVTRGLRPFLKTRSHDESAHTFKSSLQFLEVPQKGVLKNYFFCIFLPHFFTCLVLSDPLKFFKSPGSWHECRPIYGLHFVYIGFFYPLYKKKGVLGVQKNFITSCWHLLAILADFLS